MQLLKGILPRRCTWLPNFLAFVQQRLNGKMARVSLRLPFNTLYLLIHDVWIYAFWQCV
jgi:hypothetical protein